MSTDSMPTPIPWHLGVNDAHCHPTDTPSAFSTIPHMNAHTLTVMSTRTADQSVVADLARKYKYPQNTISSSSISASLLPTSVIPSFGYHPWFSHLIFDDALPELCSVSAETLRIKHFLAVLTPTPTEAFALALPTPRSLSSVLSEIRFHLEEFPRALVGEIGIDRSFRLPYPEEFKRTLDLDTAKRLSNHKVTQEHQKKIFEAQMRLAGEMGRSVSVHSVQYHGGMFDTVRALWKGHEVEVESKRDMRRRRRRVKGGTGHEYLPDVEDESSEDEEAGGKLKPFSPRICLHSFSAPLPTLKQWLSPPSSTTRYPSSLFFSFSSTINASPVKGHMGKIAETIEGAPDDSILVESDLHTAGEQMDAALEAAVRLVAEVKGWDLEFAVKTLAANWRRFVGINAQDSHPVQLSNNTIT